MTTFHGDAAEEVPTFGLEPPTFDDAPNRARIAQTIELSTPPKGTYLHDAEQHGEMTIFRNLFQSKNGTMSYEDQDGPRRMVRISGRVQMKETSTYIRFQASPDARKKLVFEDGKPTGEMLEKDDSASNRWAEAYSAFTKTYGEEPKSNEQIIDFLQTGSYRLRCNPFNGELAVVKILALKDRG